MTLGAIMRKRCNVQQVRDLKVFSLARSEEEGEERKIKDIEKPRWKDALRTASLENCRGSEARGAPQFGRKRKPKAC